MFNSVNNKQRKHFKIEVAVRYNYLLQLNINSAAAGGVYRFFSKCFRLELVCDSGQIVISLFSLKSPNFQQLLEFQFATFFFSEAWNFISVFL